MKYYSAIKKNEIMPFVAIEIDLKIITLDEVSQRNTNIVWLHSYVESNFFKDKNELVYKTETDLQILKINLW